MDRVSRYSKGQYASLFCAGFGLITGLSGSAAEPIGSESSAPAANPANTPEAPPSDASQTIAHREWLRWWIFDINPRISAQVLYDDNVNISSVDKQSDVIWVASPGIRAVAGDTLAQGARILSIDYSPSFLVFTDHDEYDSIDHAASVSGLWPFSKLTLGFRQSFDDNSGGVVDVGSRVDRQIYNTALTSSYEVSEKTSFEINAHQKIDSYPDTLISSKEWISDNWLNYLARAKLVTGLGVTFGYLDVDNSPGQTYEQVLLRAVYKLTYKLDLAASAGGEFRQFNDGPNRFAPVFSLGATYWPRDGTTISLSGHRDNRNSAVLEGQNYISTGISASVRQRLWERVFGSVGGTYDHAEYESAINGVAANRSEDYYQLHSGVDVAINERWIVGIFYRFRENLSNTDSYSFNNNQVGLQTSYQF